MTPAGGLGVDWGWGLLVPVQPVSISNTSHVSFFISHPLRINQVVMSSACQALHFPERYRAIMSRLCFC